MPANSNAFVEKSDQALRIWAFTEAASQRATVTGSSSLWQNFSSLYIGYTGALNLEAGGKAINTDASMPSGRGDKIDRRSLIMQTDRPTLTRSLLLAVVAVVGLKLRPFLTAIGPLASTISREIGLNYQSMALLTLVPILLMGICAFTGSFL